MAMGEDPKFLCGVAISVYQNSGAGTLACSVSQGVTIAPSCRSAGHVIKYVDCHCRRHCRREVIDLHMALFHLQAIPMPTGHTTRNRRLHTLTSICGCQLAA